MITWREFINLFRRKRILDELRKKRAMVPAIVGAVEGAVRFL